MSDNRVELKTSELDNVIGGLGYDPKTKTIHANNGGTVYHYNSQSDLESWVGANYKQYLDLGEDGCDAALLKGLLDAGIIY
jgi:hypothetical protein